MTKILRSISAVILLGFGLLTLFLSTSVIFDSFDIRAREGNYVLFVVWSNFIASILYLFSAFGFFKTKKWTSILLVIASVILLISYNALKEHVSNGGLYEEKTLNAMIFRIAVTLVFTLVAYFTIRNPKSSILSRS